jgi:hypothetical protein
MEPEVSLPYSKEPATYPYPEPSQTKHSYASSLRPILMLSSYLSQRFQSGLFSSGLPTESLHAPLQSPICDICFVY